MHTHSPVEIFCENHKRRAVGEAMSGISDGRLLRHLDRKKMRAGTCGYDCLVNTQLCQLGKSFPIHLRAIAYSNSERSLRLLESSQDVDWRIASFCTIEVLKRQFAKERKVFRIGND